MITKKSDGSQVKEKESTDSSTTIEDDDVKGKSSLSLLLLLSFPTLKTMIKFTKEKKKLIQFSETSSSSSHLLYLCLVQSLRALRRRRYDEHSKVLIIPSRR
jgi:hypothetical protein